MNNEKLSYEKIFVFGLMTNCPEGEPLIDCPLEKYRKLSKIQRINNLEKLSDKETDNIIKHHHECLLKRINFKLNIVRGPKT